MPLAVLPLFADQPYNAARVQALGAGIALGRPGRDARTPCAALLAEPSYAARALEVAAETRELPPVADAVLAIREYAHA